MEVATNGHCSQCGGPLPGKATECPSCGVPVDELPKRPRFTFAILILLLIIGFTVTGFIVRAFDARRSQLAERWFGRGNRDLQSGVALQAIDEFQTALAYDSSNSAYRLKLAMALMQAGKWEEARAHLLNLWEERPGDGEVNLLLARVFAQRQLTANAVRYYQGAIYGVWSTNPIGNRERTRFELVEYLLSHGRKDAAQAELIALAAEAPEDLPDQVRLGNLLLQANEPERALEVFRQVRRKQRRNFDAAIGEAQAEFSLSRFSQAAQLAREAAGIDPSSLLAKQLAADAEALVAADPRARGIGSSERRRRAFAAYKVADARLEACSAIHPENAQLQQLGTDQVENFEKLKPLALRDTDLREQVMRWVFDVELAAVRVCGTPSGTDATLLRLAQAEEAH